MMTLFLRGFIIVALVSWNVRHIAALEYAGAFMTGTLISVTWFWNTRHAAHSTAKLGWLAYGLGAGCGTVVGMWMGR